MKKTKLETTAAKNIKPGHEFRKNKRCKWRKVESVAKTRGIIRRVDGLQNEFLAVIINKEFVFNFEDKLLTRFTKKTK